MISVVICTYNRAASLSKTLESLRTMVVPNDLKWELVVIDNNSTDHTAAVVKEFALTSSINLRYAFEPTQGLCHARNAGIANSMGEIIAFTDDDVLVSPHWLREIARAFKEFNCLGLAGRSIPAWNELPKPRWLVTDGPYCLSRGPLLDFDLGDQPTEIFSAPWGLNMAFTRSAFEKYGLFRTDLDVSGTERLLGGDTEFGYRLIDGGERIMYSPNAVVFHPVEQMRLTKSYFLQYYFNSGRESFRKQLFRSQATAFFGLPRWVFRRLIINWASWFFAVHKNKRFYNKAQFFRSLGGIAEACKYRKRDRKVLSKSCNPPPFSSGPSRTTSRTCP